MPCLIALGSKLGNKGKFIPMLMYRDGSCWMWPNPLCNEKAYDIKGFETIENCAEVTIKLNLKNWDIRLSILQLNLSIWGMEQ